MKKCRPSPARYTLPPLVGYDGHDIRKQRMPAYTFGLRTQEKDKNESPGPNTYRFPDTLGGRDKTMHRAPAHSMHARFDVKDHITSPGPNTYGLQDFKPGTRAPVYSMGSKIPELFSTQEC